MRRFWVSWWSTNSMNAGCTKPPFDFWVSGERYPEDRLPELSLCAHLDGEDQAEVWQLVERHFPDYEKRFIIPKPADWTPDGDRFEPIVHLSSPRLSELDREFLAAMGEMVRLTCEAFGVPSRLFPK